MYDTGNVLMLVRQVAAAGRACAYWRNAQISGSSRFVVNDPAVAGIHATVLEQYVRSKCIHNHVLLVINFLDTAHLYANLKVSKMGKKK